MKFKDVYMQESKKLYFQQLMHFLDGEYEEKSIFPPREQLFDCFKYCDLDEVKVVILGQDPYHGRNQAMGLSFSVPRGVKIPPSLLNIYKELADDVHVAIAPHGDLTSWAKQGVLLLNTVLSVEEKKPNSHKNKGWEIFTDRILEVLNEASQPIVFILWGSHAQQKAKCIRNEKHLLIESVHPSPLSSYRGFFGSKPFSKANAFLKRYKISEIDWSIQYEV